MSYQKVSSPELVIRHTGQVFPLTQAPVTIGRQADSTIVLADPQASRQHAAISWQTGTFIIQDLGSANGTYVNDRRITAPQPLRDGDAIRIGNTFFDARLPPAVTPVAAGGYDRTVTATPVPEYDAGDQRRSMLPIVIGLLLGGIILIGLAVVVILFLSGGKDTPTVTIQSPAEDVEVIAGREILLQATAAGAPDITRLELIVDDLPAAISTSPGPEGAASLTVSRTWTFDQIGLHVVSAVAYTVENQAGTSTSIDVTVVAAMTPTLTATPTTDLANLPDLLISSIRIDLETGDACNYTSTQLGVRVSIENDGGGDAGSFVVDANGAQQTIPSGLAAGQTAWLWFPGYVLSGENRVTVDATNQVQESSEANNTLSQMVPIPTLPPTCTPPASDVPTDTPTPTPSSTPTPTSTSTPTPTPTFTLTPTPTPTENPPQYDLYVRRMDFSPNLIVGETIQLNVMIATDTYPGEGPFFPACHFRWRQGPSFPWQEEVCPENREYASCTKTLYFSYSTPGDYYVEVEADSRNEVRETNEGNNASGWTITVNPQAVTVNFEAFPDGTPINSDVILGGDEFLAKGIRLEGAPADPSCDGLATVPAIRRPHYGITTNFLTTAEPGDPSRCNFGPVGIRFTNPARTVTLTFAGATAPYTMQAFDSGNSMVGLAVQGAVAHGGTFDVTVSSTSANITRVTLGGPPSALTAITQVYFEQ